MIVYELLKKRLLNNQAQAPHGQPDLNWGEPRRRLGVCGGNELYKEMTIIIKDIQQVLLMTESHSGAR